MIIANFEGNESVKQISGLHQYDKGQVLQIMGLNLPRLVEIDFSLEETGATSKSCPALTKDGITEVTIPNEMLVNKDTNTNYNIYAFVYVTDANVGETVKTIIMEVRARTKPEQFEELGNRELFEQAIEAVKQSDKSAEGWAHGREDMPERATDNAKYYAGESAKSAEEIKGVEQSVKDMVATVDGIEQQVQDVKEYAGQAKIAAENALLSEQEAKKAEEASLQHRTGAETAENNAELAEQNAKKSEQAVEQAKQLVMQMGQEVLNNKNHVDGKVEEFNKTVKDASDAIETAETGAVDAVETAGTEQTKKVADEGAKQVKAVEEKGNEVLQSIPQFPTSLPNPYKLTFNGAVTAEYDGSGAVTVTIPNGGDAKTERVEKLATDIEVQLEPNKLYIFPEMENLTYTLKEPADKNVANEYHFVFASGASPTQVVHPLGIKAENFNVQANRIYEVSIMENLLTSQSWEAV